MDVIGWVVSTRTFVSCLLMDFDCVAFECLFEFNQGAHDDEDRVCDRDVRSVGMCVRGARVVV